MVLNKFSESEIIQGLMNGNKSVFADLFSTYYAPLCAYAATIVKYRDVAEEIVQDTFIKIWENHPSMRIITSLRSYLYKCVHNNTLNYIKSLAVTQKRSEAIIAEITYHAAIITRNFTEETLENIISDELETFINVEIQKLPDQCREVFCLSRYEQLTYNEIAERLNISVNTVKTQITRALDKLREALKNF